MRPIIFIFTPIFLSIIVSVPLLHICTETNNRRIVKYILAFCFLYLSAIFGNVLEPALNNLYYGEFYSDGGFIGTTKKVLIIIAIYSLIIFLLSTIIKFKSKIYKFAYIFSSSLIYGILFNYFLRLF